MPRPKAAEDQHPLPATPRSADRRQQRRRSTPSARTRRSLDALEADKENQFTSTPIKGEALGGGLRDVSNLTPTAVRTQTASVSPPRRNPKLPRNSSTRPRLAPGTATKRKKTASPPTTTISLAQTV
nr:unnamed protein product [Callosobruchus analis]